MALGALYLFLLDTPASDTDENPSQEGDLFSFEQTPFMPNSTTFTSLSEHGYIFIPDVCQETSGCHLHIAFHGCAQNDAFTGLAFFTKSGYNAWAMRHKADVILYPQVIHPSLKTAWDAGIGGATQNQNFLTRDGLQIQAVHAMAKHLLKPRHPRE